MADKIRPACLPLKRSMDQDLSGRYMVAAGWGKQSDGKYLCCTIYRAKVTLNSQIDLNNFENLRIARCIERQMRIHKGFYPIVLRFLMIIRLPIFRSYFLFKMYVGNSFEMMAGLIS